MTTSKDDARTWNATLWISQFALAWVFGVVGVMRAFMPIEQIQQRLVWADASNGWWLRGTGYALIAVAVALILPGILRVGTRLVPATAIFMGMVMMIAAASHIVRRSPQMLAVDLLVAFGCAVVVWGRTQKVPFVEQRSS